MLATTLTLRGGGAGGPVLPALVAHTNLTPAGSSGGTTPAIITTTANLIVVNLAIAIGATPSLSDSKSNSWTLINTAASSGAERSSLYYCLNPIVGTGHTFTLNNAVQFESMCVAAFSGVKATLALDQNHTGVQEGSGTTVQPGSITPSVANSLIVCGLGTAFSASGAVISINGAFSPVLESVPFSAGTYYGSNLAYMIQGAAAAVNPTWTSTTTLGAGNSLCSGIASFKPA